MRQSEPVHSDDLGSSQGLLRSSLLPSNHDRGDGGTDGSEDSAQDGDDGDVAGRGILDAGLVGRVKGVTVSTDATIIAAVADEVL